MTLTSVPSPVSGVRRYEFHHDGRLGVVAGSGRFWKAGWVMPSRSRPFGEQVAGTSRGEAVARLVGR